MSSDKKTAGERSQAYKQAGVDIEAGNSLVSRIRPLAAATFTKSVITDIGGFGGLFKLDTTSMEDPVLVSSTDGVGTKLKLAFAYDGHDGIGIDLVAMSANDILVQGAKPLFFLDYFATGKLDLDMAERVIKGIAEGCKDACCSLIGGETAEMPDFYHQGEYDLAGFCVGLVDNAKIVDGSSIGVSDAIIGLKSTGAHANGYSLIRKLAADQGLRPGDPFPGETRRVAEVLLAPTRIYVKTVLNLLRDFTIKGMVHVTGGGFYDNVPRILPRGVAATFQFGSWTVPPLFAWLKEAGALAWEEMFSIFNCGIGYMLVVDSEAAEEILGRLNGGLHEEAWIIGSIVKTADPNQPRVVIKGIEGMGGA